ncbi:hypothetical protein B0H21DRAFT_736627 [Amylocystis lapponica]|nr:hypothetical protein B0H21DRAFT_736627 [Amylocystis lapponica]
MTSSASPSPAPDSATSPARADNHDTDSEQPAAQASSSKETETLSKSESPASEASTSQALASHPPTASAGAWQAVWSPAHNAYYFYNAATQETTWTNPLQSAADTASASSPASSSSPAPTEGAAAASMSVLASTQAMYDLQAAAAAQGIDPSLAYLDPSLAAGPSAPGAFTYTAKFNSRTGAFARPDARDPTHLSEYERAKRMSEFYFDVGAWEKDVEARKLEEAQEEEEGRKRKRPTKKDLERFKEQKRLKKIAKTAWLRT